MNQDLTVKLRPKILIPTYRIHVHLWIHMTTEDPGISEAKNIDEN